MAITQSPPANGQGLVTLFQGLAHPFGRSAIHGRQVQKRGGNVKVFGAKHLPPYLDAALQLLDGLAVKSQTVVRATDRLEEGGAHVRLIRELSIQSLDRRIQDL